MRLRNLVTLVCFCISAPLFGMSFTQELSGYVEHYDLESFNACIARVEAQGTHVDGADVLNLIGTRYDGFMQYARIVRMEDDSPFVAMANTLIHSLAITIDQTRLTAEAKKFFTGVDAQKTSSCIIS